MNYTVQSNLLFGESEIWFPNSSFNGFFEYQRDAMVDDRIAHPTDENIETRTVVDDEQFGIEVTQVNDDTTAYDNIIRLALWTDETRTVDNQTTPTTLVDGAAHNDNVTN